VRGGLARSHAQTKPSVLSSTPSPRRSNRCCPARRRLRAPALTPGPSPASGKGSTPAGRESQRDCRSRLLKPFAEADRVRQHRRPSIVSWLPLPARGEGGGEGWSSKAPRTDEAVGFVQHAIAKKKQSVLSSTSPFASARPHPQPLSRKRERGANRRGAKASAIAAAVC